MPQVNLTSQNAPSKLLKHLKTGDVIALSPPNTDGGLTPIAYKITGAEITHKSDMPDKPDTVSALVLCTNYPFGWQAAQTPLRYVVYAVLHPQD